MLRKNFRLTLSLTVLLLFRSTPNNAQLEVEVKICSRRNLLYCVFYLAQSVRRDCVVVA